MQALIDAARKTFPGFPSQVFELWLDDRVREKGWPPQGIEWWSFLAGESIEYWQALTWSLELVRLKAEELTEESWGAIHAMIGVSLQGKTNAVSAYLPDTKIRFESMLAYACEHGVIPCPVILLKKATGYHIVDGHHRIAVVLAMQHAAIVHPNTPTELPAWVASKE